MILTQHTVHHDSTMDSANCLRWSRQPVGKT
ncbi:hypothetical protein 7711_00058 [Pseudomonas phage bmx-p1]|nr:hypothetical protein 7711_00058 [Pseudomonas phage bmx-p1]